MTLTLSRICCTVLLWHESYAQSPLLSQIGGLYLPNAYIDDVNSIAVDVDNRNIYATNTASGTIDIISYSACSGDDDCQLTITRSIDIQLQASLYFSLDYISSIAHTSRGYMVATLIPLNYALNAGWLVFIDVDTGHIESFVQLQHCYSPKHILATADGHKLVIACEGLADGDNDPEGALAVVDLEDDDANHWRIYHVDFTAYNACDDTDDDGHGQTMKTLPDGIYIPKPEKLFSINAEPESMAIDDDGRYVFVTLQENNGVAVLDLRTLEIVEIFSMGAHHFGFSGLDASDADGRIHIARYENLYGLRQPDGIAWFTSRNGKRYIFTANEGNAKYYDTVRVNQLSLDDAAFPSALQLGDDDQLGRLQVMNEAAMAVYAPNNDDDDADGTSVSALYAFGSRDFTAWQVEGGLTSDCPCDYPYALRLKFSSLDDFEQITAAELGTAGFNSDFDSPSFDVRSDDKGPEPEIITVGECSNGDVYVFIGLERVGGIMVYDITDIDMGDVYFVEYFNSRDFEVVYDLGSRPPQEAGDIEPETMIFVADTDDSEQALLFVAYKTSASIGVYQFDCGCHRDYKKDNKPTFVNSTTTFGSADECIEQSPCINVDVRAMSVDDDSVNGGVLLQDEVQNGTELYAVCMSFDVHNPYCTKDDDYFTYGYELNADDAEHELLRKWYQGSQICHVQACGQYASFALMDGVGCSNSEALMTSIDSVDRIQCQSMDDGDACLWNIPTPACGALVLSNVDDDDDDDNAGEDVVDGDDAGTTLSPVAKSDDASTCDTQGSCLQIVVEPSENEDEAETETYRICVYWDADADSCSKRGTVPFASATASASGDDTVTDWYPGITQQLCLETICGESAMFGIRDEHECGESLDFLGPIDDVDGVSCVGMYGGYGIDGSCEWQIPAPLCSYTIAGPLDDDQTSDGVLQNLQKKNGNAFDTITNKGGHFHESAMFYILLAVFALTLVLIVFCVYKQSQKQAAVADSANNNNSNNNNNVNNNDENGDINNNNNDGNLEVHTNDEDEPQQEPSEYNDDD